MKNQNIELEILRAIQARAVPTGATALTEQLNLPQATIGRIMNRLDQMGYLKKISNKGRVLSENGEAYLNQMAEQRHKEEAAEILISSSSSLSLTRLVEILEIRRNLEQQSVRLACEHATSAELESLKGVMLEYLYEINSGGMGSAQDLNFHLTLARYSGNETLYQILTLLLTTHHAYADFALHSKTFLIKQADSHHEIIQALLERSQDKAAAAMASHLDNILIPMREKRDAKASLA